MRTGLFLFPNNIDTFIADVKAAAADGFPSVWIPQIFGHDALTMLALAGREVPGIELGTAVVPTYPRHPMMLAQQALTTNTACGGRFTLGIGLSHQIVIEGMYGMSFDKPAIHMRDYLTILTGLLRDRKISYTGKTLTARGQIDVGGAPAEGPKVLIAALAPKMLELAGSVADGTITWMTGPDTVGSHINPTMRAAAEKAGRAQPRTVVGLPICVTDDAAAARARAATEFAMYGQLPSYRAMLDKEGAGGPADVAIIGDEAEVRAGIERIAACGADDFVASAFGSSEEKDRTRALLRTV